MQLLLLSSGLGHYYRFSVLIFLVVHRQILLRIVPVRLQESHSVSHQMFALHLLFQQQLSFLSDSDRAMITGQPRSSKQLKVLALETPSNPRTQTGGQSQPSRQIGIAIDRRLFATRYNRRLTWDANSSGTVSRSCSTPVRPSLLTR